MATRGPAALPRPLLAVEAEGGDARKGRPGGGEGLESDGREKIRGVLSYPLPNFLYWMVNYGPSQVLTVSHEVCYLSVALPPSLNFIPIRFYVLRYTHMQLTKNNT